MQGSLIRSALINWRIISVRLIFLPFKHVLAHLGLSFLLIVPLHGHADKPDVTVTFLARPTKISDRESPSSIAGHTYIVLSYRTSISVKEQVYGFYPKDGGRGQVRGPGLLTAENRCTGSEECSRSDYAKKVRQLGDVVTSTALPIDFKQQRKIFEVINKWNAHPFDLVDSNCVTFISEVFAATGYTPPAMSGLDRVPVNYLNAIKEAVRTQDGLRKADEKVRLAEERKIVAEALAEKAEAEKSAAIDEKEAALRKQRDAEKIAIEENDKRLKAEARLKEALEIPHNWVKCTCPLRHKNIGRMIDGVRWHSPDVKFCN